MEKEVTKLRTRASKQSEIEKELTTKKDKYKAELSTQRKKNKGLQKQALEYKLEKQRLQEALTEQRRQSDKKQTSCKLHNYA